MERPRSHRPDNYAELLQKFRRVEPKILENEGPEKAIARQAVSSGLEPYGGLWDDQAICHLLKRSLFGVKMSDLSTFRSMTLDDAIGALLQQNAAPDPPVNNYNNAADGIEDPDVPYGESWIEAKYINDYEGARVASLKTWLVGNILNQKPTLEEKMVLFWHNLLVTQSWGIFHGRLSYRYFEMLRRNAFGNYKTLIKELTLDPAMLIYLNGTFNNKEAPDENYARELQELFCIGKGPNAKFTEEDVQAAARVLTGWLINWEKWEAPGTVDAFFYPPYHDSSDKEFSSFYGNRVITGRSTQDGAQELDELLDMIFDNNETALYICRRIYNFFVYHEIDETTEANVIVPLANLFRESGYEIKPVMEALLKSAHFHDPANHGAVIKNPADFVLGLWRTLDMDGAHNKYMSEKGLNPDDLNLQYKKNLGLIWNMANIGMELGDPPSVAGWPAYYQAPSFDKYWITTDTIANRAISSDSMVYWGFWVHDDGQIPVDLIAFLQQLDNPEDPNLMLKQSSLLLHGIQASDEVIENLKKVLLSGQQTDSYWSSAWMQLMSDPDDVEYRMVVENRLKPTFQHLMQLGETQLM